MKKFTNAAVVISSNDKGLHMVNFVHDLQVYNNTKNNIIYVRACFWASYERNVKYKVKMICTQSGTPAAKCDRQLSGFQQWVLLSYYGSHMETWEHDEQVTAKDITPDNKCCTSKPR